MFTIQPGIALKTFIPKIELCAHTSPQFNQLSCPSPTMLFGVEWTISVLDLGHNCRSARHSTGFHCFLLPRECLCFSTYGTHQPPVPGSGSGRECRAGIFCFNYTFRPGEICEAPLEEAAHGAHSPQPIFERVVSVCQSLPVGRSVGQSEVHIFLQGTSFPSHTSPCIRELSTSPVESGAFVCQLGYNYANMCFPRVVRWVAPVKFVPTCVT